MNEVNSTTRNTQPYANIGLIETTWADGSISIGTCSLVGRNDILTAGHCVYDPDKGGWGENFKFYFGADYNSATGSFQNLGVIPSFSKWETIAWTSQIYTDFNNETMISSEAQYDVAVIGIDTPIGDTLGWLGLASGYDGSQTATAVGYPAGSTGMMQETAYVTKSSTYGIYESGVYVMGPGSSGGPLLIDNYVIGVKSTGYSWADIGYLYNHITNAMTENDSLISGAVLDTTPPTIQISTSDNYLTTGEVATIFFKLSESCNDFTLSDITVSGGILSDFQGSGQNYSAIFTPTTGSAISAYAYVWKNAFSDLSGNFNIDGNDADNRVDITVNTLSGASVYESEPNNVFSSATLVSIGGGAKGQLYISDIDYYKLHITTPGLLSVTFGTYVSPYVGEIGQTNLSIRNDSGIVLSSVTAYNGKVLSAQIGAPGDVYIRLSGTGYWAPDTDPYDLSFSFVSSDATPPTVISFTPADESTDVAVASNIVITFSEAIARGTGSIVLKTAAGEVIAAHEASTSTNLSISGNTLTIVQSNPLSYSTGYKVEFAAGSIKDLAGNSYAGTTSYNFTTKSSPISQGGSGDDTLTGGSGNQTIDGGAGFDTSTYSLEIANYQVTKTRTGFIVTDKTNTDGTDTISNIERLQFTDLSVNLTIQSLAASAPQAGVTRLAELYVAFFNRIPDADGLEYWIGQFKAGMSIGQIADAFYAAGVQYPALTGFSPSMSNADFVNVVYRNVLGRKDGADAEGLAYWSGALDRGTETKGSLVQAILGSAHTFKGNATWGWVADLLDNKAAVADTFAVDMGLNYLSPQESISKGMQIAAAVTPTDTAAAIALIGVSPAQIDLV